MLLEVIKLPSQMNSESDSLDFYYLLTSAYTMGLPLL